MKTITTPLDWPKTGPIDLEIHDLPHDSSTMEWWYINAHIEGVNGNKYSVFASFFRKMLEYDPETQTAKYGHSISWALIDLNAGKYYGCSLLDKNAPEIGLKQLREGMLIKNKLVRKAAIEMLEKGSIPFPDRVFRKGAFVSRDKLKLEYDDNVFTKKADGSYDLVLADEEFDIGCHLAFQPMKSPVRHGEDGVVKGHSAEDMFYYFISRNKAEGYLDIKGERIPFTNATAWYDHEFGAHQEDDSEREGGGNFNEKIAWN